MGFLRTMALGAVISVNLSSQSLSNLAQLTRGLNQAESGLGGLARGAARVGAAGFAELALGGAVATGVIAGVAYEATQFDKALHGVASVGDTTAIELDQLSKGALKLSGAFSATEILGAMEEMRRAGMSVEETLKGISTVSNVAQADAMTLASSTEIVGAVWRSFGGDFANVGDVIIKASADTATSGERLGQALSYAGPLARILGIDLESASAALGELAQRGLDSTKSGRGLSTSFVRLLKPTKAAKAQLKELHFAWVQNEDGSVNLVESLRTLKKGFEDLHDPIKEGNAAAVIFGADQVKAGANLINLVDAIEKERDVLYEAHGASEKMAAIRLDTPIGQFTILGNKAKAFAVMMGQEFIPGMMVGLHVLVDGIQQVIDGFDGVGDTFLNGVGGGIKLAIDNINYALEATRLAIFGIGGALDETVGSYSRDLGVVTGYLMVMGTVGLAVFGPFAGMLSVILYLFSGLGDVLLTVVAVGLFALSGVFAVLGGAFVTSQALGFAFSQLMEAVFIKLSFAWNAFTEGFVMAFKGSGVQVAFILAVLSYAWENLLTGIQWGLAMVWGTGLNTMMKLMGALLGFVFRAALAFLGLIAIMIYVGSVVFKYVVAPIAGMFVTLLTIVGGLIVAIADIIFAAADAFMLDPFMKAGADYLGIDWSTPEMPSIDSIKADMKTKIDAIMAAQAQGSAQQKTTGENAPQPQLIDKRCLHIKNDLSIDGKNLSIAKSKTDIELSERAGFALTPWQRRQILEHGAQVPK